jgi:anti-sigma regulatory factor (Ser/Thr protein kinase)
MHDALFYSDVGEYVAGVGEFVRTGLAGDEPVLVAVPAARLGPLRAGLGAQADRVRFLDMTVLGRNPARIIPTVRAWCDEQRTPRRRFVGEPIWAGRRTCESLEAARHEALINTAFCDVPVSILCPYDSAGLAVDVLAAAEQTHPTLMRGGDRWASHAYTAPADFCAATALEPAPAAESFLIGDDLAAFRRRVRKAAGDARLRGERLEDFIVAVNEAASNTLLHAAASGRARIWQDADHVVCEIADRGRLVDPLAGRRRPDPSWPSGRGLWIVNQLCDFVELHAGPSATTLRLHMRLG